MQAHIHGSYIYADMHSYILMHIKICKLICIQLLKLYLGHELIENETHRMLFWTILIEFCHAAVKEKLIENTLELIELRLG